MASVLSFGIISMALQNYFNSAYTGMERLEKHDLEGSVRLLEDQLSSEFRYVEVMTSVQCHFAEGSVGNEGPQQPR
jgi:hypothetical protein